MEANQIELGEAPSQPPPKSAEPQNEEGPGTPQPPEHQEKQPPLTKKERLQGAYNNAKKKLTCGCSKVTVRAIKLGISLWMVADLISDGFNTKKYLDYAEV